MRWACLTLVTLLLATVLAAQARVPLNRAEIYRLKAGGVSEQRILKLVAENGINFEPTDENLQALKQAGATPTLLDGLRQARLKEHIETAKKLDAEGKHGDAQKEWRLALAMTPSEGALHLGLGESLLANDQLDDAIKELDIAAATEPEAEDALKKARERAEREQHEAEEASRQQRQEQAERQRRQEAADRQRQEEVERQRRREEGERRSHYAVIYGTVYDAADRPMSGVKVTLENSAIGFFHVTTTGSDGTYNFEKVPPATDYKLTAEKGGRIIDIRSGITLEAEEERVILPPLQEGKGRR